MESSGIFKFKDNKTYPDTFVEYSSLGSVSDSKEKPAVVIDNGSYQCRMGWSCSEGITECLQSSSSVFGQQFGKLRNSSGPGGIVYKNVMAKTRREKGKESELQVANDIVNIEAVRYNLKTPFDRNVVTQFETQEILLDYGFTHLGLNESKRKPKSNENLVGCVPHPIVMSEPFGNPNSCRAAMNELMFECYSVPSVAYGVDALFSLYENQKNTNKTNIFQDALIVSIGFHTIHIIPIVNGEIITEGVRRINIGGFHLTNYGLKAMQLKYPSHVNNITVGRAEEILQDHCHIARDYNEELRNWTDCDYYNKNVRRLQLPFNLAPKAPTVDPEIVKQRRQELAKRLVEMNTKKREEKMAEDKASLKTLHTCLTLYEQGYEDKVKRILTRLNQSNSQGGSNDGGLPSIKSSEDLVKLIEKTKIRIEKAKAALEKKKNSESAKDASGADSMEPPETKKRREDMDEAERKEFDSMINEVKSKRQELMEKRAARHLRKQQLSKRRTAASQERMRIITQLAKKSSQKDIDKDNFGMEDSDWDVYKQINKDLGDSDSEEEQNLLNEYDSILKENGSNVDGEDNGSEISRDSPEWHQLHLATEQIRISEILFQPSIIGHEQAGISETIEFILKKFSSADQQKLVSNIFITGAVASLPGIKNRLEKDLKEMRPFKSSFKVKVAKYPSCDSWNGAKKFANNFPADSSAFLSRQQYQEMGSEYLATHLCSNFYTPTPDEIIEDSPS